MAALPAIGAAALFEQWSLQPLALVAAVGLAGWYRWGVARLHREAKGPAWRPRHSVLFGVGLALFVWTTNGFPEAYSHVLFADWTSQYLGLLLVVPIVLMSGQPIELARRVHGRSVTRLLESAPVRVLTNPLVGPALIPVLSAALFFGPLPGWAITHAAIGWPLELLVTIVGAAVVLPLVGLGDDAGSLAVALALLIGFFELLVDAVPGIALRLNTHLVSTYFDHRTATTWAPKALRDQQIAGSILWIVAEVIDLPFLLLVFRRWIRADARDAAQIDTVLDAERIARGDDPAHIGTDAPWWLDDPSMRRRYEP